MKLRPAQAKILEYQGGKMAVRAVPGSGKTFILSRLAAQLIAGGRIDPELNQQVLIVTYLNSSVDTFQSRIRQRLEELERPFAGYDVRTLHSLALEIVQLGENAVTGGANAPVVADDVQRNHFLAQAISSWIGENVRSWRSFIDIDNPQSRARWRGITEQAASAFIRAAKNERYHPAQVQLEFERHAANDSELVISRAALAMASMFSGIYANYQATLARQSVLDFDDLIWRAADMIERRPDLTAALRQRWPFILEDEAQDSVPLQEALLSNLAGPDGNWVRVGDPNQAIMTTFTAADPSFFNRFIERDDVTVRPLPNSGRCAPTIYRSANELVRWTTEEHPLQEVRQLAFLPQEILPAPDGDAQPNPPDEKDNLLIRVFRHREDEELPSLARWAASRARKRPGQTVAVLVPTNETGHQLAAHLDELGADYDNLLRGGSHEREVAAALVAVMSFLSDPLDTTALVKLHASLGDIGHNVVQLSGAGSRKVHALLRSVRQPEELLFPGDGRDSKHALPETVALEAESREIEELARTLKSLIQLRYLPIDDFVLALADELFPGTDLPSGNTRPIDRSIAYLISYRLRVWQDLHPDWRLPELVAQLNEVATGRRQLITASPAEAGFKPLPGRITLATQHKAKGLEWDAVFLAGIDNFWVPSSLEAQFLGSHDFLGGDPSAEAIAQLRFIMDGDLRTIAGRTATETANIALICERLRLLYVGITRARRFLLVSRSKSTRFGQGERTARPSAALGALSRYLNAQKAAFT